MNEHLQRALSCVCVIEGIDRNGKTAGRGQGVFIAPDYVLTARHVLENASKASNAVIINSRGQKTGFTPPTKYRKNPILLLLKLETLSASISVIPEY